MKKSKLILMVLLLVVMVITSVGCGKKSKGDELTFWYYGDGDMVKVYNELIEEFNKTVGAEKGFTVKGVSKPSSGYVSYIQQAASGSTCADVFVVWDRYFKLWSNLGYLQNLDSYVKDSSLDLDDIYPDIINRYRYNVENNTSNIDDSLYSIPVDSSPTALYYNKTAFEKVGITCISVDEDKLAEFNAGTIADNYGKTKADYGITIDVPARGFYRSMFNYTNGSNWMAPFANEEMIFNNRIPMNWDEIEDVAMMLTKSYNPSSPTTYGYYTEWWFNYGWSVGGDCAEDTTGNGDWIFTLGDENPNYIANQDVTINGNNYKAGETVTYLDKNDAGLNTLVSEGKVTVLPSTREAFTRFVNISQAKQYGGIEVCPVVDTIATTGKMGYFYYQNVAMMVEQSLYVADAINKIGSDFEWDVAPLPIYKQYDLSGNVVEEGRPAGHSSSTSISMWTKSEKKDQAWIFMEWMANKEAQTCRANMGYLPNQISLQNEYLERNKTPNNIKVFVEAMPYETPGDWMYMADKNWITVWSNPLNHKVRNGTMTLDTFFNTYIEEANRALENYK